jgi:hypothetical protein
MKASANNSSRSKALITMLFGALITVLPLAAYGQQEDSPSWYDPWGGSTAAATQSAKPAVAAHKQARAMKSASTAASVKSAARVRRAEKLRAKRSTTRPTAA